MRNIVYSTDPDYQGRCPVCEEPCCEECLKSCSECEEPLCLSCIEDDLCPTCKEKQENQEDENR